MSPMSKRGPWSQQEDNQLLSLVDCLGPANWVRIASHVQTRSPKQCRERYHQNLKPSLNHSPITPEEGEQIERMVQDMGKRWAEIARRLPGRSDNAVKNWYNGGINRRKRVVIRRANGSQQFANAIDNYQQFPVHRAPPPPLMGQRPFPMYSTQPPTERPLISPTRSEVSMPDSVGEAPSLVSDTGSHQTVASPNVYTCSPGHIQAPFRYQQESWQAMYDPYHYPSPQGGSRPSTTHSNSGAISKQTPDGLDLLVEAAVENPPAAPHDTHPLPSSTRELPPCGDLLGGIRMQDRNRSGVELSVPLAAPLLAANLPAPNALEPRMPYSHQGVALPTARSRLPSSQAREEVVMLPQVGEPTSTPLDSTASIHDAEQSHGTDTTAASDSGQEKMSLRNILQKVR